MGELARIKRNGLCHGCGACATAVGGDKIKMSMTSAGYLRPEEQQPLATADEEIVQKVCSGAELQHLPSTEVSYDRSWGPIVSLETGFSTDADVRYLGSSGGVISAIAIHLLETRAVDFILHTSADPNDPVGNITRPSTTRAEIIEAAGSRYAPSAPLADLEAYLSRERTFAFIGKPCDVAALRRMARSDPRIDRLIPFKISFFCAGVPSRKGALAVVEKLGVEQNELVKFSYRGRGWPGWTRATRRDGSEEKMDYNSSWGYILSPRVQFRCKICPDGTGEFADITCADAWYSEDGYPDFTERDGRSLIMARTPSGRALLDTIRQAGALSCESLPIADIRKMQPHQYNRKRAVFVRLLAMRFKAFSTPKYRGLSLLALALQSSPVWLLRNFLGTYLRLRKSESL
ncbi:Coenzyme F420 hydrogenase/dehydrogenase, beta subunit C-terminal domain [Bradyrhizobium sp. CCGUVB1N3]|uniref:Coenzyme F420 hydrogenase/dehydrogenase, beta subunit C-terminal domain n=1 Tax=Bradyrhizobium sp. CCGUVB1N3 TaxID=2949629 RepID=UPI0020B260D0|nr:Coenzyme F420 hydrogenase/dehydrogenase, beta subunit C-terminal domain [Bradyrhizobium sp. CCGUVB1N3]MCP3472143.1 Coenzyme F420 hydrogenase/dehydrogenase, beta subunit C-terminal domain [Bradyrhizobium sp. CCGUVB1N3]